MIHHPVYIVGAGVGDPDLLTRKAYRLITEWAEIVVYDRLISEEILALIPEKVERVYVGKSYKNHAMCQEDINATLVEHALLGKKVVRLKGGDPFIFGRGGEEVMFLQAHDISVDVVPGITSASAISAKLGIPLTHRGVATGVRFITGHQQLGEGVPYDWQGLADSTTTLVVYMGLMNLPFITESLMQSGMEASTPVVAIENGTTPNERCCWSTIGDIVNALQSLAFQPPTLIIIGKVVEMVSPKNS